MTEVAPPSSQDRVAFAVKRAIERSGAFTGMLLLAPVMAGIAIAIRLESRGPALYEQERLGRGGRPFRMLKFRTMLVDVPTVFNADGSTRVAQGDPRVTRVGKWLRGGLDELPQLWNVVRGEMSVVGPRPEQVEQGALYTDEERKKLEVPPGMTSLAAVVGRNEIPWKKRIAIDLRYLERWSLWLDARIAIATLLMPFGLKPFRFKDVLDD